MTRSRKMNGMFGAVLLGMAGFVLAAGKQPAEWVNPLVGTDSSFDFSTGNTYPALGVPWGMNFWTPQTNKMGNGWIYQYDARKICGFRQTHQPSPWINDYGAFSLMPVEGQAVFDEEKRASWFSHKTEISKPYYYRVYLGDSDTTVEMTALQRAVQFRFTCPQSDAFYIVLDAFHKGSWVKILPEERMIVGFCRNNSGGVPDNFANYFAVVFDRDFEEMLTWNKGVFQPVLEQEGEHVGAAVRFQTRRGQTIHLKAASSFISVEQARLNLRSELGDDTFAQTCRKAEEIWNRKLGQIEVQGGTEIQRRNFYTALYRTLLFPRDLTEINAEGQRVHYSPYNGKVLPGPMYTDNGFWDTFRAAFPLTTLLHPQENALMMEGLANTYRESGWLPEWASPGHRDCMIGSHSAAIIADSYLKGIRGYDIETLYEAILKNTENAGPLSSLGRLGVSYYNELGYIPCDAGIRESAARTLEYSYDDFTIWKLAQALNRPQEEIERFQKRAQFYRNIFDPSTNFMRGRKKDGSWSSPFLPEKWGGDFTEGCAWHYTWSVFHDPQGLIDLMGGPEAFVAKMDAVFDSPPKYDCSYYGFPIHEIIEMIVMNFGQYAHGNQPIQHMIYLYAYAGQPWKTQKWAREVMDRLYHPTPDGLCGDEDNGQTSAWYVFSALGFYPVCPGTEQYVLGSPLFERAVIHLQNGKSFEIKAVGSSSENRYIQSAKLNGRRYSRTYLNHSDIFKGGRLELKMGSEPNLKWGSRPEDAPYSMSREKP